jgi:RNA polymerase sigma factor (sigma-70 family)
MSESPLKPISDSDFLRYCAEHREDYVCWNEFVSRFQSVIARSVSCAYRRFTHGGYPPSWQTAELVQEVYLRLIKDDCALLRRFRGITERAAKAYLAQIALNSSGDILRREIAKKRQSAVTSLEEDHLEQDAKRRKVKFSLPEGLAERELLKLLAVSSASENTQRDVLIFLLHIRGGLTAEEIATHGQFNLQPPTIWSIIIRLRGRLRRALNELNRL